MIARAKTKPSSKCIVPACKRDSDAPRGLCTSCYQSGLKLVNSGATTWLQLEQLGLSRPKSEIIPESANPLRKAFATYIAANPGKAVKVK